MALPDECGVFRSADDGLSWTAVATQNLPNQGNGLTWRSNKKGLMLYKQTITSEDPSCKYWTDQYWSYNCSTHLFEPQFSQNSHSCWHSGGISAGLTTFNDDQDWFYRTYSWMYGGPPPPCNEVAYYSTDGGQIWHFTNCEYAVNQHTDSIFYLHADSLWLNPPGTAVGKAINALPVSLSSAYGLQVAHWGNTIAVLYRQIDTFQIFFTTDLGLTWQVENVSISTSPYTNYIAFFAAAGHFFIKNDWYSYFAPYTSPGAMLPLHPEGVAGSDVLWVNSDKWWIRTRQSHSLVSDDYGLSWQEVSLTGFGPTNNAALIYDGHAPWARVDGNFYQIQADESLTRIDSAFAVPAYPRLDWERDTQRWILLKTSLLHRLAGGPWDTVAQVLNGDTYERSFTRGGRLYALKYDWGNHGMNILFSDSTGNNWTQKTIQTVRDFTVFQNKWFKISYALGDQSKLFSSTDLGETWQPEQPADWTTGDVFQVYQNQLYVTVYVPALQGRRIARWNTGNNAWEIIGLTTGGGNCNAWIAEGGFYLLQNTNSKITLGTYNGDLETALHVPFTYSYLYNYNPLIFVNVEGAQKYRLWGQNILARPESGGIWIADIRDLLDYQLDLDTAVCAGQSVTIGDSLVQQPGTYPLDSAMSILGLDSLTMLHLIVYPVIETSTDTILAIGSVFQGWTVTRDTVITQTLQTIYGCDSTVVISIHAQTTTTQDNLNGWGWIGPNPFTESISLFAQSAVSGAHLQLLDRFGRTVWASNQPLETGLNVFNVPKDLPAGIYMLLVKTDHFYVTRCLVRV